ncbi:MAG: tRNA uridine-5-carboxymethylaminomethyl(34) synthesis GTPase MnmE [Anaerolineae bacterium]|jgi:tRNA modification GTPase
MYSLDDTIAAISTPAGEGGIGIVRMTGPDAASILRRLFEPGSKPHPLRLEPRTMHYGHIVDPDAGATVDEVLAVYMPAPRTYTRQDVVEINGHGGIVALRRILSLCLRQGARVAEAGEFTARAFLNGRLDLAQAEAVLDVVQAKTEVSLQAAVGQLEGHLSGQVGSVRARLVEALAYLEATIDFEEDEIPEQDIGPDLDRATIALQRLLADADRGIIYRQGIRTAIVGCPNVGKSSLLNRLLRTSRAIVTEIPGTTRDTLEETLNLQGVPVVLVDTAGIAQKTEDPIERLGIERSRTALAQADLALLVVDASQSVAAADRAIAALVKDKAAIVVLNKIDLLEADALSDADMLPGANVLLDAPTVPVSALTGQGLGELEEAIVAAVFSGQVEPARAPLVTSPRHKEALNRALDHLVDAHSAYQAGQLADLVAIDLTAAIRALGEITGQAASEDLVETIFGKFCIGK